MKFIIPENFNFKNKLFGFIDYSTAIFDLFLLGAIYFIIGVFVHSLLIKLSIVIILFLPIFMLSIIGFNNEPFLYTLFYVFKYLTSPKVYLYS